MAQLHCNFYSYSLGYGVDMTLLLPSMSPCDFDPGGNMSHRFPAEYPVLYLLHGHGNDYMCWNRFTRIQRLAEERRMAVVTVSVGNKGYMNAAYGENYFDFVAKELPEFVTAHFPISGRREDTYIAGNSMGGYGALAHALVHPECYRAVGAFSPAISWGNDPEKMVGHSMPPMTDLYEQLDKNLEAGLELPDLFCCIGDGDFLLEDNDNFHAYLQKKGVAHVYDRVDGFGHEWGFWDVELPVFLDWLPRTDIYAKMPLHRM